MPGPLAPRAAAAQKAVRAIELRDHGHTWDEIAQLVGFSAARSANRAATRYLASHPSPEVDAVRADEERQLLLLRKEAWKNYRTVQFAVSARGLVTDDEGLPIPDYSHKDRALNTLLRISESRRRLHGADRLAKDHQASEEIDAALEDEFAGWMAEVQAQARRETEVRR
jgi:hypothetical protein